MKESFLNCVEKLETPNPCAFSAFRAPHKAPWIGAPPKVPWCLGVCLDNNGRNKQAPYDERHHQDNKKCGQRRLSRSQYKWDGGGRGVEDRSAREGS